MCAAHAVFVGTLSGLKDLALVTSALAIPFGMRALVDVAWKGHPSYPATSGWLERGRFPFGLPRSIFLGTAFLLAVVALVLFMAVARDSGVAVAFAQVILALVADSFFAIAVCWLALYHAWAARGRGAKARAVAPGD
jgi:hypothetical protein